VDRKDVSHQSLLLSGAALISWASLLLEITLTRVYAALFFYRCIFVIPSIAVLGIGLGAALAHHFSPSESLIRVRRLTLLLGHPTRALAMGLFAVLINSGLGSLVGGRLFKDRAEPGIGAAILTAGALALAYLLLVPALTSPLLSLPESFLVVASVTLVLLPRYAVPAGAGLLSRGASSSVAPLVWSVNGVTSVVGSVGDMALAILWSFDVVMIFGSGIYLAAALLCRKGLL